MSISPLDAIVSSRIEPASARSLVTSTGSQRFSDHFQPYTSPPIEPPRREPQYAPTESTRSYEQNYREADETTSSHSEQRTGNDSPRHSNSTSTHQEVSQTESHNDRQDSSGENTDQVTLSREAEQTGKEEADAESLSELTEVNAQAVESTPDQLEPINIAEESPQSDADLITGTLPQQPTPDQPATVEPTVELTVEAELSHEVATETLASKSPSAVSTDKPSTEASPAPEAVPATNVQKAEAEAKSSKVASLTPETAEAEQLATAASESDNQAVTKVTPSGELKQALSQNAEESTEESDPEEASDSKRATSTESLEQSDKPRSSSRKSTLAHGRANQAAADRKATPSSQPATVAQVEGVAIESPASTMLDPPATDLASGESSPEAGSVGKPESLSVQASERSQTARFAEKLIAQSAARREGSAEVRHVDQARFVQRVAGAFARASQRDGELRLRLSPPELGSLKLQLKIEDGAMTARLEAESSAARSLLLENLPSLRERLAEQNIRVERFEVELQQHSQTSNGSDQQRERQTNGQTGSAKQTQGTVQQGQVESGNEALPASVVADKQINIVI